MSQRASGYARMSRETYLTPAAPVRPVVPLLHLFNISKVWEPAPAPGGQSEIANVLRAEKIEVVTTTDDFLTCITPPEPGIQAVISNPPYGAGGRTAVAFIERALWLTPVAVIMLLKADFDSAKTRTHLFGDCPVFSGKIVPLDRITWFKRDDGIREAPSENHAWFVWWKKHRGAPGIYYARSKISHSS
jgi:hypothetical protein